VNAAAKTTKTDITVSNQNWRRSLRNRCRVCVTAYLPCGQPLRLAHPLAEAGTRQGRGWRLGLGEGNENFAESHGSMRGIRGAGKCWWIAAISSGAAFARTKRREPSRISGCHQVEGIEVAELTGEDGDFAEPGFEIRNAFGKEERSLFKEAEVVAKSSISARSWRR